MSGPGSLGMEIPERPSLCARAAVGSQLSGWTGKAWQGKRAFPSNRKLLGREPAAETQVGLFFFFFLVAPESAQ